VVTVKVASNPTFGHILVDSAGMALYTYGPDEGHNGMSKCTGTCLQEWPALGVPAGTAPIGGSGVTGTLAAVKQANGTFQVTYDGSPLYTFVQDSAPGQATGNNVAGFSVAKASSSGSSSAASSSTTASTSSGGNQY
jgi:predicted lipoprotein with Yx(FWY)xxD motif